LGAPLLVRAAFLATVAVWAAFLATVAVGVAFFVDSDLLDSVVTGESYPTADRIIQFRRPDALAIR